MIPDIAFMIVVYGAARLVTAALETHRRGSGDWSTIATALTWLVVVAAVGALAFLGYDVFHIASANTGTNGLT